MPRVSTTRCGARTGPRSGAAEYPAPGGSVRPAPRTPGLRSGDQLQWGVTSAQRDPVGAPAHPARPPRRAGGPAGDPARARGGIASPVSSPTGMTSTPDTAGGRSRRSGDRESGRARRFARRLRGEPGRQYGNMPRMVDRNDAAVTAVYVGGRFRFRRGNHRPGARGLRARAGSCGPAAADPGGSCRGAGPFQRLSSGTAKESRPKLRRVPTSFSYWNRLYANG